MIPKPSISVSSRDILLNWNLSANNSIQMKRRRCKISVPLLDHQANTLVIASIHTTMAGEHLCASTGSWERPSHSRTSGSPTASFLTMSVEPTFLPLCRPTCQPWPTSERRRGSCTAHCLDGGGIVRSISNPPTLSRQAQLNSFRSCPGIQISMFRSPNPRCISSQATTT